MRFHMVRFHVVLFHGCRLPIAYAPPHVDVGVTCKADIICITQITFKEIYNVLLVTIGGICSSALNSSLILWLVKTG